MTGNPWGIAGALGSSIPRVRCFVLIRRSNEIVASSSSVVAVTEYLVKMRITV